MKIKSNGIDLNYEISGEGACLVLIHGFTDNLSMWFNQVPFFSEQYRVLSYDVRGHGKTKSPPGTFSLDLFTRDLHGLLKALNIERACILGFSMGGRIALQFALDHPEMTSGLILANLSLMGPGFQATDERSNLMQRHRNYMANLFRSSDIQKIAEHLAKGALTPAFNKEHPAKVEKYKKIKLENDPQHFLKMMEAITLELETLPEVGHLDIPTLIVAGEHDALMTREILVSMENAFSGARRIQLPTGHASAIEAPEEFNQAVFELLAHLNV